MDNRIRGKMKKEEENILREITGYFKRAKYYRRLWEARMRGLRKRLLKWAGWTE